MNISDDIEGQIQDLVDGHLDDDQQRVLVERIANDPELTRLYVSHVGLDLTLSESMRFSPAKLADLRQTPPRRPRILYSILMSAAVVALSLLVLRLVIVPEPPPLATFDASPGTVFQIQRADEQTPDRGSLSLNEGDVLTLTQGVVELGFGAGVRGIVEGPAKVVFEKKDRVTMTDGRAFFEVPAAEAGFRVITRDLVAIDLGTQFAIKAGDGGLDEVHVIQGKVEVAPRGQPGRGKVVEAGQARSSFGGLTVTTPFRGASFLKHLPARLPYLHLPGEVQDDGSLVIIGDIAGDAQVKARFVRGELESDALPTVEGRFGSALRLTGKGDHVLTDWMGIGEDDPRTVAFWVRMNPGEAGYDTACVVWGFRPPKVQETVNRKWNLQVALDRDTQSRCIVNATFGGLWFEGSTSLDDGRWHHVAAVYAGRNFPGEMPDLRLFVDGREESGQWVWNEPIDRDQGEVSVRTETRERAGAKPLRIGMALHDRYSFRGELDEIFVIAGALEAEAVQALWKSNRLNLAQPRQEDGRDDRAAKPGSGVNPGNGGED